LNFKFSGDKCPLGVDLHVLEILQHVTKDVDISFNRGPFAIKSLNGLHNLESVFSTSCFFFFSLISIQLQLIDWW